MLLPQWYYFIHINHRDTNSSYLTQQMTIKMAGAVWLRSTHYLIYECHQHTLTHTYTAVLAILWFRGERENNSTDKHYQPFPVVVAFGRRNRREALVSHTFL